MRLFVGLDLPWDLRQRLAELCGGITGARWIPPEYFHLTLRFIGEADRVQAEEIDLALTTIRAPAFSLTLAGIGTFAKAGRAISLWTGVDREDAMDHLQSKIETALQRAGLAPERRRFTPHVTLARLENVAEERVVAFVQTRNLFRSEPVQIDHFTLFSSHLHREGSTYTAEIAYPLT